MSYTSDYLEQRKKRKKETENTTKTTSKSTTSKPASNSYTNDYIAIRAGKSISGKKNEDIGPVKFRKRYEAELENANLDISKFFINLKYSNGDYDKYLQAEAMQEARKQEKARRKIKAEAEEKRTWFSGGALSDGYDLGDITKNIIGTTGDVVTNAAAGVAEMGESAVDAGAYVVGGVGRLFSDDFGDSVDKFIADDIINTKPISDVFDDYSFLGDKTDSLVQSGTQLVGTVGLQAVGVPWYVTTGVTSFGGGVDEALNEGASYGEAGASALIKAGADILTEKLFRGSGLGEKGLFNLDGLTKGISNKAVKALADFGVDMTAEGSEEVVASVISRLGSSLYKEENVEDLLASEEAVDEYIESFIGGMVLSGGMNVKKAGKSVKNGTDYRTGFTAEDQKVFDKLQKDAVAEQEKSGKKASSKDKRQIYDNVMGRVRQGDVSIDTIEEVLGGEMYQEYKNITEQKNALTDEISQLENTPEAQITVKQRERLNSARIDLQGITEKFNSIKSKLSDAVSSVAKNGVLAEAYNEKARRGQAFSVDLEQYDEKEKATYERAMQSGVLNNTNKSHAFVSSIAKIEAAKGITFDFVDNAKLKESGFALEGKTVNGFAQGGKITVNVQSAKSWQSVVGHEISHVLEGTEHYTELRNTLFEYAKKKGEFETRKADLTELYKNIDADIDAELTADLVGDYLFSDKNFIRNLTSNRNLFQKVYDEVKYLCKVATGKEKADIEKVKHEFDKVWKEFSAEGVKADGKVNLSVSETTDGSLVAVVDNDILEKIAPVKGSLSKQGEQLAPVGNYSTPLYETALAPLREEAIRNAETKAAKITDAPVVENAVTDAPIEAPMPTDADAPFPNEITPMTEEEANAIQDEKAQADAVAEGQPKGRKQLHHKIIDNIKSVFSGKGLDFDEVLKKAKNLSTFSTVDNTPQRVMEKALGYKEGQALADLTVNKVAQNETEGIKWLISFTDRKNGLLAQLSKKYNIKPRSKESAAAQMYAEGFYVNENNDIVEYGDTELAQDFPDVNVRNNIKGLANDPTIRQIYDATLKAINESRVRNAYPEIQRLENYYLHFRAMNDTFSRIGLPFNPNDIKAKDLPTDLNGVTADLKPGQPYFASANHRTGKRTSFDLLGGLEQYLTSAKNQIYHIDDIQTLRALRNYIADNYGQANGLEGIDALTEEEAQEKIEQVYGSHLSTFAKFLNEEANVLAGKTALIDRGLEGVIGRRGMTFMDSVRKQVGSNMIGLNVSSSLTNVIAGVQAIAKTNKAACVKSLAQTTSSRIKSIFGKTDSFVENNPTIIRRKGAERFSRTPFQKVGDAGYVLMSAVDNVTTEFIVRAKYNEFIKKGMSEQDAITEADKWTSRLMGDRSLGQMPQIYNSKTLGLITQFQLEVRNQLDSQFYDTIKEAKASNEDIQNGLERNARTAAKVTKTFFELAVLQHLFGKGFEAVAGYNPAFDIISVLTTALGFDDDEESEDTALDNIEQGFLELLGDLPYTSMITDGGRIPISSALPIKEVVTGKDEYGNEKSRLDTIKEALPYYLLPTGYGQIKKTAKGLSMYNTDEDHPIAGSYTDSGALRFPVDDTVGNRIQAGIFGQYANKNAREYFDNNYAPLKEKQIEEYTDVELPIADYWKYREGLKGLDKNSEKADYINSLDIEDWQKNLLMNNILDRKENVDMSNYDNYNDFEEFDYAQKNPEKYEFLKKNGISYKDYASADEDGKRAYSWAFENPEKYTVSKVVAADVVEYRSYTSDIYDLKADKDSSGKTISGSKKEKVVDYINNLDLDYGQKIILYRSLYDSKEDKQNYNADIVEYLNNRDDLTYEERVTIFKELGFTVEGDSVYWD